MPYVTLNGRLTEITQEQFDIYTIGQNQNVATATTQTNAANIAAGGTVTQTDSTTSTILTPNTTNTSPNQTLLQSSAGLYGTATPIPVTPYYTDTPGTLKVYGDATPVSSTVNPQAV
jgi:hypothetical protein